MHMQRMRSRVRDAVRENVPLEVEVERARSAAASMIPEIRQNQEIIVREKVEIDELRGEVKREQRELVRQRNEILALRARLTVTDTVPASATPPSTASLSVPREPRSELRKDLQHRFAIFQSAEATLSARTQMIHSREESLAKAVAAQNEIVRKRRELEAQVANLEIRLKL